jgi:hypothetical protein
MEIKRVAAVTGGLVVVGGIAGALASALAVMFIVLWEQGAVAPAFQAPLLSAALVFGALYGAVLGPLAAWVLMRHVPLGIAIGGTMLGTLIGGVAALLLDGSVNTYLTLPLAGFVVAALAIRIAVPRRARVAG